ncbi:hypothetical protein SPHV1_2320059 [Novosphingobium sp. KN65.2]|nr:hypothetical protein SPHV1_2320059 [Novosphingobium sp. KN65.2]
MTGEPERSVRRMGLLVAGSRSFHEFGLVACLQAKEELLPATELRREFERVTRFAMRRHAVTLTRE